MKIALTGNPNSGKTTMFNALTGSNEKVGNWAGVTVDTKERTVKKIYVGESEGIVAVDLPGAYSMSPYTSEESITSTYIKKENPDVIINIVDATNLSRSLFFTTQILELGIPVVIALNKSDINRKKDTKIDVELLSKKLGCPVVSTVSVSSDGLKALISEAVKAIGKPSVPLYVQKEIDMTDKNAVIEEDRKRFSYVKEIVSEVENRKVLTREKNINDKIDEILTNKWLGIPLFALVMWLVFQISQVWVGTPVADFLVGYLESFQSWAGELASGASPLLKALLIDGIIGGAIAVIGFLPLVMVMYFFIAILEDCGYMSRVAIVLDPLFKRVGLSGKSVIPFVMSVGCAVPGVMASRTIRDDRERRASAMLAPFMPCGAKIPVIALFAGKFFDDAGWISTVMYLMGIVIIFFGALLVNKITGNKIRKAFFIMEMPEYKVPSFSGAVGAMVNRGWEYVVKAATVILLCNTVVQIMQSFTWSFQLAETADSSILASVSGTLAYIFVPVVGVLSWQLAAAAITGFIAKENVVGTLAVCFMGLDNLYDAANVTGAESSTVFAITKVAALAYLMFNLYSPPCFAAMAAMRAEMKSSKWLFGGIALQLSVGYSVSYFVYTVGTLITAPETLNKEAALAGLIAVAVMVAVICVLIYKANKKKNTKRGTI